MGERLRFYIATRLERADDHRRVRGLLEAAGHQLTYDWTAHGSVQRDGVERLREVAQAELQGVLDADVVVVLLPGGRGTHAELGIALGAGKPVVLHAADDSLLLSDERTCAFYHHPLVRHVVGAVEVVVVAIAQLGRAPTQVALGPERPFGVAHG